MKILIADSFPSPQQDALQAAGHTVTFAPELLGEALGGALQDHDILIVRSTRVDASILDAGAALKLVIRAGAGTNTIDKDHASTRGVAVCNVPGANAVAVAELVMGLMIAIDRDLPANVADLRRGHWDKKKYATGRGLLGRTLGIFGLGAIGAAVAQRAHAFGMPLCTPTRERRSEAAARTVAEWGIAELAVKELLARCDIITLHLPFSAATDAMVNREFLTAMRDDAILINTSRGELVDEAALVDALDNRGICAGLDVYRDEPAAGHGDFPSALARHPRVYGTHHIGASTAQAQTAVADGVLKVVAAFTEGHALNCVNS